MKRALVTGGCGFLGSHLCERLLNEGYEVVALDNLFTGSRENVKDFAENPRFSFIEADVAAPNTRELIGEKPFDEIYNLACPASPIHYQYKPLATTRTSVFGILLTLDLAVRDGAKLLHCSTSEIYGDPLVHPQEEHYWGNVNTLGVRSCYDEGKRVAETFVSDYIREYDVDARMVRIFNTYGPRMHPQDGRVVSNFIMQALRGEDLTIFGDGSQTRSFQFVSDLVEAMRRYMTVEKAKIREFFAENKLDAPVINVGNPGEYTVRELAEKTLEKIAGTGSKLVFRPLPGDDPKKRRPDITLARRLLDWSPMIPLDEGLAATIAYFRNKL